MGYFGWVKPYFGWVELGGALSWMGGGVGMNGVGGDEWGWVHCLIIPIGNATSGYKRKVVVAPHRKAKQVRSNKQTLSEIANGLKALAENSRKYNKMMIEEERKLEERYLSFQREEVEKNRQQELLIAQMFVNASQPEFPYRSQPGYQGNSSTSSTSDPHQPVKDDIRRDSSFYLF